MQWSHRKTSEAGRRNTRQACSGSNVSMVCFEHDLNFWGVIAVMAQRRKQRVRYGSHVSLMNFNLKMKNNLYVSLKQRLMLRDYSTNTKFSWIFKHLIVHFGILNRKMMIWNFSVAAWTKQLFNGFVIEREKSNFFLTLRNRTFWTVEKSNFSNSWEVKRTCSWSFFHLSADTGPWTRPTWSAMMSEIRQQPIQTTEMRSGPYGNTIQLLSLGFWGGGRRHPF
jgi:hypothetical protein